jgi:hypothetical protein
MQLAPRPVASWRELLTLRTSLDVELELTGLQRDAPRIGLVSADEDRDDDGDGDETEHYGGAKQPSLQEDDVAVFW